MKSRLTTMIAIAALSAIASSSAADTQTCGDLDGSGTTASSDALLLLRFAVGQPVAIECPTVPVAFCWDTNPNQICDAAEDINEDQGCDALDCQGPAGPPGPAGPVVYSARVTGFPGNNYWYGAPLGFHDGSYQLADVEMLSPPYDTILTSMHGRTVSGGAGGNFYLHVNGDLAKLGCPLGNGSCSDSGASVVPANSKVALLFAAFGTTAQDYLANLTLEPCNSFCGMNCCVDSCCGDVCVDTSEDEANCGECGIACPEGAICAGGGCIQF